MNTQPERHTPGTTPPAPYQAPVADAAPTNPGWADAPRPGTQANSGRPGTPQPGSQTPTRAPLSWALIIGLGALTLLWPLTAATPIADQFGGPERAIAVRSVIAIAWILVVLLARAARPLATLTLAGLAAGVITLGVDVLLAPAGLGSGLTALPFAAIPILATQTLFGAVTGLIALGLQKLQR
ncbi:hypothetical protein OCAE111667_13080 [Occultella aeris]|uniref:Uncharacterized protein n=1 Tax=Occultella aeris TaxID=2761496 RepID=A0A7M4DE14_9MICO|nr:hypothetical protein [Occultella aeris]VZO35128.1 hypothetical protein HALOF300_00354 [Occultella aeris]